MRTSVPDLNWRDDGPMPRRGRLGAVLVAVAVIALCAAALISIAGGAPSTSSVPLTPTEAAVDPGLVDVTATLGPQGMISQGTGMVLSPSGRVLTNNHVIDGATSITVTDVGNGRTYRAAVTGYDSTHDIAVLQLADASGLRTVPLGSSASPLAGQRVWALGNAGGAGGMPSAATGTITGLDQSIIANDQASGMSEQLNGMIQTSAPVQQGDSGGPLVDSARQVIGMTTAVSAQYQLASPATEGFAIPIGQALATATQIADGKASATIHIGPTAFLGVEVATGAVQVPGDPAAIGAGVADVTANSPAAGMGMSSGDVIVSIGGHTVASSATVRSAMDQYHPGDRAVIRWADPSGQVHSAAAVFTSGPAG